MFFYLGVLEFPAFLSSGVCGLYVWVWVLLGFYGTTSIFSGIIGSSTGT